MLIYAILKHNKSKHFRGNHMNKYLFRALVILCIIIFLAAALYAADYLYMSNKSKTEFENLASTVGVSSSHENNSSEAGDENRGPDERLLSYQKLHEENPDMVGWIKIDGTTIDYPVMQTKEDPEFYLRRDFSKEQSQAGTPFIDAACTVSPRSDNIIIYGHNMSDKTMFAPILSYEDPYFYRDHKKIEFNTIDEIGEYEIFAVLLTNVNIWDFDEPNYYGMVEAQNAKEFNQFVDMVREASLYETGIEPRYGEKLISLSTCEYSEEDGRMMILAREIPEETDEK